jgi:hypothetical protein
MKDFFFIFLSLILIVSILLVSAYWLKSQACQWSCLKQGYLGDYVMGDCFCLDNEDIEVVK